MLRTALGLLLRFKFCIIYHSSRKLSNFFDHTHIRIKFSNLRTIIRFDGCIHVKNSGNTRDAKGGPHIYRMFTSSG